MSHGGEDVKVTIGGDASPLKQVMSQITTDAKKLGETLGLEIGNKGAFRDDMRYERSLNRFLRVLNASGSPVEIFTAAIESMGKAFRVAGVAMLGLGVGAFLYEQVEKAIEAHKKLTEKFEKAIKINVDNESIHQMQRDVDGFQKIQEEYEKRGLIEKILFGTEEEAMFKELETLNTIKKNLIEIDTIKKNTVKSQARILAASENPEDRKRAHQMLKAMEDDQAQKDAQQQLEDALEARKKQQEALDKLDEQIGYAKKSSRMDRRGQKDRAEERERLVDGLKNQDELITSIKEEMATNQRASAVENAAIEAAALDSHNKEQTKQIEQELKKRVELRERTSEALATPREKVVLLSNKIIDEQKLSVSLLQSREQKEATINQILEDQLKLKTLLKANDEARAKLQYEVFQNIQEQQEARGAAAAAGADAMGFHGQVDSLRRQGFAGRVGSNQNSAQLKIAAEANKKLDALILQGEVLNGKVDSL